MFVAFDKDNNYVNVKFSNKDEEYYCPFCKEKLIRNYGLQKQYFSHTKGLETKCEMKILSLKKQRISLDEKVIDILNKEYYKKNFNNITTELSEYKSEEGYYLTKEQENIIKSTKNKIKISATAGSSKTTTLYYYAKENPDLRILYLVYNAAMKKEAEKTFGKLENVQIKTVHGLAYQYVGNKYKNKLINKYYPIDVIKDLNLNWEKDQELAVKINELLLEYLLSDKQTIEEVAKVCLGEKLKKEDKVLIQMTKNLWKLKKEQKNDIKIEHDFYLKLFHLAQKDLSYKFDVVMLDEAQDSNLLTFDIVKNLNIKKIIIVGDPYQQMYRWRKAKNILNNFKAEEYTLKTSFRVSQQIANIANIIIKEGFEIDLKMKGFNADQTIVDKIDTSKKYTCISRTNGFLFEEVLNILEEDKNKKLFFEGGYKSYRFNNIRDVYYFSIGKDVNNSILNKFENYNMFKKYVDTIDDIELASIIKIVDKYGSKIPKIIQKIKDSECLFKEKADIIFTTAHKSKGETYENVKLTDDFIDLLAFIKNKISPSKHFTEVTWKEYVKEIQEGVNILYVAITRASKQIQLNDNLKKYLYFKYLLDSKKTILFK